ncbi:MAG: hypothetical protein ACFE68_07835 [Candidatus Hodarchaeota archaeon]
MDEFRPYWYVRFLGPWFKKWWLFGQDEDLPTILSPEEKIKLFEFVKMVLENRLEKIEEKIKTIEEKKETETEKEEKEKNEGD